MDRLWRGRSVRQKIADWKEFSNLRVSGCTPADLTDIAKWFLDKWHESAMQMANLPEGHCDALSVKDKCARLKNLNVFYLPWIDQHSNTPVDPDIVDPKNIIDHENIEMHKNQWHNLEGPAKIWQFELISNVVHGKRCDFRAKQHVAAFDHVDVDRDSSQTTINNNLRRAYELILSNYLDGEFAKYLRVKHGRESELLSFLPDLLIYVYNLISGKVELTPESLQDSVGQYSDWLVPLTDVEVPQFFIDELSKWHQTAMHTAELTVSEKQKEQSR